MKKRLLLVEDHKIHGDLIRDSLEEKEYEVEALRSYESAREVIKRFKPQVLVLDNKIGFQKVAGQRFLAENRELLRRLGIGVVFISAYMFEGGKIFENLKDGTVEVLAKPLDIDQLVLAIKQVLKRAAELRGEES